MKRNKKRIAAFCLAFFVMVSAILGGAGESVYGATAHKSTNKNMLCGITLDVGNRYYSVKEIKKYIRLASKSKRGYVQLHFTGDENVGIECEYLDQTANKKYLHGTDEYYNPDTGKSFLTKKQIKTILSYAKKKKVAIIPEIDMPGHVGGFEKLYKNKYGKLNKKIFNKEYEGELLISNKKAMSFAKAIYKEYMTLFKGCKYFHIGCDEFWSGSSKKNAKYINEISKYVKKKGFEVMVWNDLLTKSNIKNIDHDIIVTYWSYDGDTESKSESKARKKVRASFPALQKEGFRVLNYNSYYLYYTPSLSNTNDEDAEYAVEDAKENWNLLKWNSDSSSKSKTYKNIYGACVSIWGEDSKGVSGKQIYNQIDDLYKVAAKKCKTHKIK
ncbi:MAG: family 20 glycosylhydrolase [Lachnospiraceae bacterium]|nr:family 20 glycosylhydrolase [Lachnospiraceae bacterium]